MRNFSAQILAMNEIDLPQFPGRSESAARLVEKDSRRPGSLRSVACPLEQSGLKLLFQIVDLLDHGAGRDVELLGALWKKLPFSAT